MSVDVRYANSRMKERIARVLLEAFNIELNALTIPPLCNMPELEAVISVDFNIDNIKRVFSDLNIKQTLISVSWSGPSITDAEFSCSTTSMVKERTIPFTITLLQKCELSMNDSSYQLNDETKRKLLPSEIISERGELYGGLIEHVINQYLPDDGVSVLNVRTKSAFNLGSDELPDFGNTLIVVIEFEATQEVSYTI